MRSHVKNACLRSIEDRQQQVWFPGGVLPYMGDIGMCGPKGYGFSAVLVIIGYRFLHSSPQFGVFFRSYFFITPSSPIHALTSSTPFYVSYAG